MEEYLLSNIRQNNIRHRTEHLLLLLLLVMSLNVWTLAISDTKVVSFPPDPLYYVKILPLLYWIGLGILLIILFL